MSIHQIYISKIAGSSTHRISLMKANTHTFLFQSHKDHATRIGEWVADGDKLLKYDGGWIASETNNGNSSGYTFWFEAYSSAIDTSAIIECKCIFEII